MLTWLDRSQRDVLSVHPRDDLAQPLRGVFSTRSADRPNPIGLHRVTILECVDGLRFKVKHLEALGIERFAVMGHSGGGPHALACGALLPDRVLAVVSVAGLALFDVDGLDWFSGMTPSGVASLRAAAPGRAAKERYEASDPEFDPEMFTPSDHAALSGSWSWLNSVVEPAMEAGPGGLIDDDLAYVALWGFDPTQITVPTLLLHGGQDRIVPSCHGEWLANHIDTAELRLYPEDGHISVLNFGESALGWLREQADGAWSGLHQR